MPYFRKGDCITVGNERIVVEKFLSSGMQADVYHVVNFDRKKSTWSSNIYMEITAVIKIVLQKSETSQYAFCSSCTSDLAAGVSAFDEKTDSFVYLMEEVPEEYEPIALIMKHQNRLTAEQKIQVCIQMAEVFSSLGSNGFIYSDISGTNIRYGIDSNGRTDVRVIDCDNVSLRGESLGVAGSGLFRSPEVLLGYSAPTEFSDAYALTVAVFRILTGSHPLDGIYTHRQPLTPELVQEYFGKTPEYIFSEGTKMVQRKNITENVLNIFHRSSSCIFNVVFSKESLHHPEKTPYRTDAAHNSAAILLIVDMKIKKRKPEEVNHMYRKEKCISK